MAFSELETGGASAAGNATSENPTFPITQYTRLSLCALPTRPYKGFIAKTQYTPPIIVLTRHFTPLQLFQNTI